VWRISKAGVGPAAPRLPEGLRVYAIGDVHGRADLLLELFVAIDQDIADYPPYRAVEVFLGDYIDRGPASAEVIDLLIRRSHMRRTVLLKGNHETFVIDFLKDPTVLGNWAQYGGLQTLMSYGLLPSVKADACKQTEIAEQFALALMERRHARFLGSLRTSFCCGDYFFVHAGVRPGVPLEGQSEEDLLWIRDDFLLHENDFGKMIVHGHTPVRDPDFRDNRINIDTGAYATSKLTCLIIEGAEVAILNTAAK
jgi:serine/threonine protein phosphatase 1